MTPIGGGHIVGICAGDKTEGLPDQTSANLSYVPGESREGPAGEEQDGAGRVIRRERAEIVAHPAHLLKLLGGRGDSLAGGGELTHTSADSRLCRPGAARGITASCD